MSKTDDVIDEVLTNGAGGFPLETFRAPLSSLAGPPEYPPVGVSDDPRARYFVTCTYALWIVAEHWVDVGIDVGVAVCFSEKTARQICGALNKNCK